MRKTTMPGAWAEAAKLAGGVAKLSGALECSPMTLYRWATGRGKPTEAKQDSVRRYFADRDLADPWGTAGAVLEEGAEAEDPLSPGEQANIVRGAR